MGEYADVHDVVGQTNVRRYPSTNYLYLGSTAGWLSLGQLINLLGLE